jgi:ubiquinone/menaquinone biosynthesis C-methylase UbiE
VTAFVDNSYRLGTFRDNDDSLRRLKAQAGALLDLELLHLQAAGLSPGSNVMDVGCGPGIISSELAVRGKAKQVIAVDCNEISLSETRREFEKRRLPNAEVQPGNIYDEQLSEKGCFDFVYARLVFQHLSEPMRAISNVRRCLSAQGRFCICDIDDRWLSVSPEVPARDSFLRGVEVAQ